MSATPSYPPFPNEPEPLSERENVELWRENVLLRAGYPDLEAIKLAASGCDLHEAVDLLKRGCSVHTAVEILL